MKTERARRRLALTFADKEGEYGFRPGRDAIDFYYDDRSGVRLRARLPLGRKPEVTMTDVADLLPRLREALHAHLAWSDAERRDRAAKVRASPGSIRLEVTRREGAEESSDAAPAEESPAEGAAPGEPDEPLGPDAQPPRGPR